jgi:hypothetical protein
MNLVEYEWLAPVDILYAHRRSTGNRSISISGTLIALEVIA